jgi:hypothetical protein
MTKTELTAEDLAARLDEPNVVLLGRVLEALGPERTDVLLEMTLMLEAAGGVMTLRKQSQRRTPGGTFFWLVRHTELTAVVRQLFFETTPLPLSRLQPITWDEVATAMAALPPIAIEEANVKLSLVGRPAAWQVQGDIVCFQLKGKAPKGLPKGMPVLPKHEPIVWTVLVSMRQWTKVKDVFTKHPDDQLIVEGYPTLEGGVHLLLATLCKSRTMEQAQREQQKAAQLQAQA